MRKRLFVLAKGDSFVVKSSNHEAVVSRGFTDTYGPACQMPGYTSLKMVCELRCKGSGKGALRGVLRESVWLGFRSSMRRDGEREEKAAGAVPLAINASGRLSEV